MPKISAENIVEGLKTKPQKRKKVFAHEPNAKRAKQDDESDDENFTDRFKFILAPKDRPQENNSSSTDDEEVIKNSRPKRKIKTSKKKLDENENKKQPKEISRNGNSKKVNGTKSNVVAKYENGNESESSDESYVMGDMESQSEETSNLSDESCEEEWSTDTDYSEGSFHESDCEMVESDSDEYDSSDESSAALNSDSDEDGDYAPPIEDKYIKKGDAIMYDGKGLDLAFGNSSESQIVDLNDVRAAVESDDEVPELVRLIVDSSDGPASSQKTDSGNSSNISSAEDTLKNLTLNDDDETVHSSQVLQRASFYNCKENRGVLVKVNKTVHFHGILVIKPLVNSIQVNGFTLNTNESLKATSISRTDYFLNLTPIIQENCNIDTNELHEQLKELLPQESDVDEIVKNFNRETDVLLHLQQGLPDTKIEMIQTYLTNPILPHKNMILKTSVCPASEMMLSTKFFVDVENPRLNAFRVNADWNNVEFNQNIKLVIIGGKNVGKSGMTQYLINKNITKYPKILLIDLDIGQPICAPSQTVSATLISQPLIGAGYLNNAKVEKSFLFGDKSVMTSPFKYNECVTKLMEFCSQNEEYKNIPWIINTMGYQKGFGLQLMCLLLRIIQPTDIVQIQHLNVRYNFKSILTESLVNGFTFSFFSESYLQKYPREVYFATHVLDSIVNNNNSLQQDDDNREWTSNATEKRKISMLAQLSKLMKGGQTYLNDVVPFGTSLENIRLIVMDEEYEMAQHANFNGVNLDLFNGNLVYLCHSENNEILDSNSILECYGVGIVRAIDKVHNYIYILLPQQGDSEKLQALTNVLAIGNIPLPSEVLLKQNFGVNGIVPHVTFFKDRNMSNKKYINKRNIKDCF